MKEWAVYSSIDGECFGGIGSVDEMSFDEAVEIAEDMFGEDVYVWERTYF